MKMILIITIWHKNSHKYFTGYNDVGFIRPLCIKFCHKIGYVKSFDSNKTMSLKVINKKLFKKYNKIWERVNNLMNIKFDGKAFYRDSDKNI